VPTRGPTPRIAQWSHFVPACDQWFDGEYTKQWGERNDTEVVVDHIPLAELPARANAEVTAQRGHDLFGFTLPPPIFEDQVIDHREIVEEVETKLSRTTPLVELSIFNAKTKKYFGFSDHWVVDPVNYRADLWDQVQPGFRPDTWDNVLRAGPQLKSMGHPLGIGMSQEIDSNLALMDLMHSFGASIQDEEAIAINRPATVEAVKMGEAIFRAGMTDEVFTWDAASNNRFLASGKGSLILNAVSALRAVEGQEPDLAGKVRLGAFRGDRVVRKPGLSRNLQRCRRGCV
jgi:multiple sugar transport system substrate-binding protein